MDLEYSRMAVISDVGHWSIREHEKGINFPTRDNLIKYASFFGIPVETLYEMIIEEKKEKIIEAYNRAFKDYQNGKRDIKLNHYHKDICTLRKNNPFKFSKVASILNTERKKKSLTVQQLTELVPFSYNQVGHVHSGFRVTFNVLFAMAEVLGIDEKYIFNVFLFETLKQNEEYYIKYYNGKIPKEGPPKKKRYTPYDAKYNRFGAKIHECRKKQGLSIEALRKVAFQGKADGYINDIEKGKRLSNFYYLYELSCFFNIPAEEMFNLLLDDRIKRCMKKFKNWFNDYIEGKARPANYNVPLYKRTKIHKFPYKKIGDYMKQIRLKTDLSPRDVERKIGLSGEYYHNESGSICPGPLLIDGFSKVFNIDRHQFFRFVMKEKLRAEIREYKKAWKEFKNENEVAVA